MSERRSRLADRFRRAVEDEQAAEAESARAAAAATERASLARDELLGDLDALARGIGFLAVQRGNEGLTLRYRERYLHFAPIGDGDLRVEFEGTGDDEHRLYRQAELGNRWVLLRRRRFREDRVPLFDQGIEDLLVNALGLPRPSDDPGDAGPSDAGSGGTRREL